MTTKEDEMGEVKNCKSCRYWVARKSGEAGICRKYAPRPVSVVRYVDNDGERVDASEYEPAWPLTWADEVCGEFHRDYGDE